MSMQHLDEIADTIRQSFDAHTAVRDQALSQARTLTRHCAHAIRAVHRNERDHAQEQLDAAKELVEALRETLTDHPSVYYAGYTQDALKEFVEAMVFYILSDGNDLPSHQDLRVEENTYLKGLAESVGEMRRRILDILRHGYSEEVERLLNHMDDIYAVLVTMDYPDAVTGGLRRLTDICRGIIERTRGDITISLRQERLEASLRQVEQRLDEYDPNAAE
jgi:translin